MWNIPITTVTREVIRFLGALCQDWGQRPIIRTKDVSSTPHQSGNDKGFRSFLSGIRVRKQTYISYYDTIHVIQKKKGENRRTKHRRANIKQVVDLNLTLSIITLNVKGLNTPNKRQIFSDYIEKKYFSTISTSNTMI